MRLRFLDVSDFALYFLALSGGALKTIPSTCSLVSKDSVLGPYEARFASQEQSYRSPTAHSQTEANHVSISISSTITSE